MPPRRESGVSPHTRVRDPSPADERNRPAPTMRKPSEAERRYTPPMSPEESPSRRVRWPDEHDDQGYDTDRSRRRSRRSTRDHSRGRSPSYSPSPERHRRRSSKLPIEDEEKPWFKKKTIWTTVASLATVAALVPTTMSAHASVDAANAAGRAANSSKRAAAAGETSAKASVASARAVNNSAIANGHQDHTGRYTGPQKHLRVPAPAPARGYDARSYGSGQKLFGNGHSRGHGRRELVW